MMSLLVLLTSCIKAISQYTKIPEKVKLFQRKEEKTAKEYLSRRVSTNIFTNILY